MPCICVLSAQIQADGFSVRKKIAMYEELYSPLPDADAYLERIGLAGESPEPTAEWLDRLIHAQLTHIPFDAMDCWGKGVTPSLAIDDLFDKIVRRHRGGYCFELNSLFCSFLRALGYEAYVVIIHLLRDFTPPPAHCAVICVIGGEKYFCDVGYGGPVPDGCVRYDGKVHHGYRVIPEGDFFCLELVNDDGSSRRVMLYSDNAVLPVDLIPLNFYVSGRPDSGFCRVLNVNFRLEDGSVWISGRKFFLHTSSERIEREIEDLDDLRGILEGYFGIPWQEVTARPLDDQPGFST